MTACPVCGGALRVFVEIPDQPVHCHVSSPDAATARAVPRGDIRLGHCAACGHVANVAFDPQRVDYRRGYDNALHFSPRFRAHADALAADLAARLDLRGRTVLEVGCGDGMFLRQLVAAGAAKGVGVDPGLSEATVDGPVRLTPDDGWDHLQPDAVVCRHVLEHLADPAALAARMRKALGPGGRVYAEVPNALFTWRELGIWDIIYEHVSYFCAASLHRLFADAGLAVGDLREDFGGQFLGIEAVAADTPGRTPPERPSADGIDAFAARHRQKLAEWRHRLAEMRTSGARTVIWGAGSKAVSFLNLVGSPAVVAVVDINPRKQGTFIAGSGHPIVAPGSLADLEPDSVLVMNANYREEIARSLDSLVPGAVTSGSIRVLEV